MNSLKTTGFTLIEVMVALAIFAIAGTAILNSAQSNFSQLQHIENKTFASWVASNRLVELSLLKKFPPKNNKKGDTELAGHTWYWQQKVEKTQNTDMYSITIDVRLNEDDKLATSSMTTFLVNRSLR